MTRSSGRKKGRKCIRLDRFDSLNEKVLDRFSDDKTESRRAGRCSQRALLRLGAADRPGSDEELAAYRKWSREKRVDGVVVVDIKAADPRIPLLKELGLPTVLVGDPSLADGMACVWTDSTTAMSEAVDHVAELGHRHIARVAGPPELRTTSQVNIGATLRTHQPFGGRILGWWLLKVGRRDGDALLAALGRGG
ncbi:hypothetical protein AB0F43_30790 [Kribbella sp. NPDC023972]|uniref:hypothetical protein n=1 Tax=Kribbella sp. NPDC023972 TaxID=3154795 RepID=UPI0033FA6208